MNRVTLENIVVAAQVVAMAVCAMRRVLALAARGLSLRVHALPHCRLKSRSIERPDDGERENNAAST